MKFISANNRNQIVLFPEKIDDYVDENNTVRVINEYIDALDLNKLGFMKAQPNKTGRPMYDPKDLLKLYIWGYMNKIRSSRCLETETKRNIEVMWLLRKLSPDHKTISRFRHDNRLALKNLFKDFVKLSTTLNLYGKELVAIDGSKFKAVNSKDRNFGTKKLKERIERIDKRIEEYLKQLEEEDVKEDEIDNKKSKKEIKAIIKDLGKRKVKYTGYVGDLEQSDETQKSLTDKDSRLMTSNQKFEVSYNVQTAVDEKNKMIAEFDVTNNASDQNQLSNMAEKASKILETSKLEVVADKGYNSASDIIKCERNKIRTHVASVKMDACVPTSKDKQENITKHKNGKTVYIQERNIALCPMGKVLYPRMYKEKRKCGIFSNSSACIKCKFKCMSSPYQRFEIKMLKSDFLKPYNDSDLFVKQIHINSDEEIVKKRKSIVEHPFGTIKRNMNAGYCLTKGFENVGGEFALTFLAYNLKRAINILGTKKLIEFMAT
jgi:transposase